MVSEIISDVLCVRFISSAGKEGAGGRKQLARLTRGSAPTRQSGAPTPATGAVSVSRTRRCRAAGGATLGPYSQACNPRTKCSLSLCVSLDIKKNPFSGLQEDFIPLIPMPLFEGLAGCPGQCADSGPHGGDVLRNWIFCIVVVFKQVCVI